MDVIVAKKETSQVNIRMKEAVVRRIKAAAKSLGQHFSALIREIIHEHLPEYERRARIAEGKPDQPD